MLSIPKFRWGYDRTEAIELALKLENSHPGEDGPWCPKCRLAFACLHLDVASMRPCGSPILHSICPNVPSRFWTKEESDLFLKGLL